MKEKPTFSFSRSHETEDKIVPGHTSTPSLHFQRFDRLHPEGGIFRDGERQFLSELKSQAPLVHKGQP